MINAAYISLYTHVGRRYLNTSINCMWWDAQGLNRSIVDGKGKQWFFKVWHDFVDDFHVQRIYFWDSEKETTGVVEFKNDQTLHIKRIKDRTIKLAKDKSYRDKFICELHFPIEKNY